MSSQQPSLPSATGLARARVEDPNHRHRLGVMGGTFDPIHHGHLVAASEVASRFGLDEVVFVPTGEPWQKADREGPTYTVDTLRDIREERGGDVDLYFITGADALTQILTWRNSDRLFDLAHFVGCTRPGVELDTTVIDQLPADRVTVMEIPALAISSTACRKRVHDQEPTWYLVPDGIVQYIAKRGLYRP